MKLTGTSRRRIVTPAKAGKPRTPDDYFAALSAEKRAALERLRKAIKAAAPRADECISYGLPAFRLNGKLLVAYGAAANHCSFYPGAVVQALKEELKEGEFCLFLIRMRINRLLKIHKWLPVLRAMPRMLRELETTRELGFLGSDFWFGRTLISLCSTGAASIT